MKGVAKIKGPLTPKVGETNFYEVVEFHKGTVVTDQNSIKWKLYADKDGKWDELSGPAKTGKKVTYSFPQKWYGKKLLVEAYIYDAEGKTPPGIVIKPVLGPKKIVNAEILDANGGKISKPPKYGETVTLKVTTENMLGDTLNLSLWERDTYSDKGHDPNGNTQLWTGISKPVDNKGVSTTKVTLSANMLVLANKSMFDGAEHEYYLLVDGGKDKMISATTQVSNEVVLSPSAPAKKADPKPAPKEEPSILDQITLKIKNALGWDKPTVGGTTNGTVNNGEAGKKETCGEKYCIKKGDKSELIREINIRLAGFGGNVPTDEFTDRTEKMIKQFQRDYMKVPETGKVCGNVLLAIDDFSQKFDISNTFWNQLKCSCSSKGKKATSKLREIEEMNSCDGFGDHTGKNTYGSNASSEKFHRYEYPGIHRSLLFGIKALQFYFSTQKTYKIDQITSGYRCRFKNYTTTNHQGKAIDIQFSKGDWAIRGEQKKNLEPLKEIRDNFYIKYLGAQKEWPSKNLFSTEPIDLLYDKKGNVRFDHTFSWIHVDVREFDTVYLDDKYFCKTATTLNSKSIVQLAKDAGFEKTCVCVASKALVEPPKKEVKDGCYCNKDLTEAIVKKIAPSASDANVKKYLDGFNETFKKFKMDSCLKKIHFFGQVIVESGSFKYNIEQGSDEYLAKYDGWHGRGLIQLTTKANYEAFEKAIGEDFTSSAKNRDKVAESPYAVYSAGWFWDNRSLNDLAAKNDFIYICYKVNGGFNHIDDRLKNVKKGFEVLYEDCVNDKDKKTDYKLSESKANDVKKAVFAWGLWHDPAFTKTGCEKSKEKAIEGYQRYIDLTDENDDETNWYGISGLSEFSDLVYTKVISGKTKKFVKVRKAVEKRLKELK